MNPLTLCVQQTINNLRQQGIQSIPYNKLLHQLPPHVLQSNSSSPMKNREEIFKSLLKLPTHYRTFIQN